MRIRIKDALSLLGYDSVIIFSKRLNGYVITAEYTNECNKQSEYMLSVTIKDKDTNHTFTSMLSEQEWVDISEQK